MILEVEPPKGVYWSYSLGNQWWETIHYGRHQSSLNAHQANIDSDGILASWSSARVTPELRIGLTRLGTATER